MTQLTSRRAGRWARGAVALLLTALIGPAAIAQPTVAPTALAPLPGHTGSDAFGVNDLGDVVGLSTGGGGGGHGSRGRSRANPKPWYPAR